MKFFRILGSEYSFLSKKKDILRAIRLFLVSFRFRVTVLVNYLQVIDNHMLRTFLKERLESKHGVSISAAASIGSHFRSDHPFGIIIGAGVVLGENAAIFQGVTIGQRSDKYPHIGNNFTAFAGSKIIGGIQIGNNVTIGANAVVIHDVPDNAIVAGVPARIVGYNDSGEEPI